MEIAVRERIQRKQDRYVRVQKKNVGVGSLGAAIDFETTPTPDIPLRTPTTTGTIIIKDVSIAIETTVQESGA